MQQMSCRLSRVAAMVVMVLALVGSAWAGGRWHVGDVIVCFGGGTCQVLRPGATPFLLDTLSDSSSINSPGATRGVAINNTLHLLVTDDGGPNSVTGSTGANIVEYQIAGEDPSGNPVPHGVVTVFDGAGNSGSKGITAVALDSAGDMFSLNSNNSSPNIVEINAAGTIVGSPFSLNTLCGISQVASMDLSTLGTSAYATSLGTIRNVTLSSPTCGLFANLGSGVTFYGIKDLPPSAIPACGSHTPCSSHETLLVAATGFFDSNGNGRIDTNDVNVCTDAVDHTPVSCALLLDTTGPSGGLTSPPWQANHKYTVGTQILDLHLHVQIVTATSSNGKSGSSTPNWVEGGGTTIDNNVTWHDQGTSVLARYAVPNQTSLQALSLDPLLAFPTSGRQVSNFWMADSTSGSFFHLSFAGSTPAQFSTSCTGCNGIQSIGVYGGEDAAQPGLVDLQSLTLTGTPTTNQGSFTFNPDGNDSNHLLVTGYNFINNSPVSIHGYASAINPASGFSDPLLTPTPPNNALISTPAAPCTVTTSSGQCVVWELDNDALTQPATCSTNPASCAFLGVQLEYTIFDSTSLFNIISAVDEQYDVTDSVDTISHYTNSQISLHSVAPNVGAAVCTYQSPLSPGVTQPPTCLNASRNTIPFKFQCTQVSSQAGLLPFLHIVQFLGPNSTGPVEPLVVLNGTGGTTNYRFDTTGQQWIFNLNNPGSGSFFACTEDATRTVPQFCTNYVVQSSCP